MNSASLYRSKKGQFFVMHFDYFGKFSKITLEDEEYAKKALGKIDVNKYIELFGEPELA